VFCGNCGNENPDVNRFCFDCGARLTGTDSTEATSSEGPLTDEVSARLAGLNGLPEPSIDWPDDLPKDVEGRDGSRLLLVPGGFFWMGSRSKKMKKDERPYRLVYLDSYYVDELPVTNAQYSTFITDKRVRKPKGFTHRKSEPDWAALPVTGVTWDDASAYAKWATRRLPTEAEWEKAARGVDGRTWPWGETTPEKFETQVAHLGDERSATIAVGSFPANISPYGCRDMAGNVWEWCQDQYDQYYYARSPSRNPMCTDGDHRYRVLRGGACTYDAFTARSAYRGWNQPSMRSAVYGFRCVADAARYRKRSRT
jgi:formylglycine-generating enzyme required for sulfatase activity